MVLTIALSTANLTPGGDSMNILWEIITYEDGQLRWPPLLFVALATISVIAAILAD